MLLAALMASSRMKKANVRIAELAAWNVFLTLNVLSAHLTQHYLMVLAFASLTMTLSVALLIASIS